MNDAIVSSGEQLSDSQSLLYTYVLAAIGFGLMIGWDIVGLYAPASPLLFYDDITQAFVLCAIGVTAMAIAYVVYIRLSSYILAHCLRFAVIATLCGQAVVLCAFAHMVSDIPMAFDILAWMLFGCSKGAICLVWCAYLSSLPTKHTGIAVGCGGVLGSVLFLCVFAATPLAFSLIGIALLPIASLAVLFLLFKGIPAEKLRADDYRRPLSTLSRSAALSNGAHGAVYGFITFYVCLMGPHAATIVGTSGIIGCFFVVVLMKLAPKLNFDNGIVQRMAQPVIVVGLLLIPFLDGSHLIWCGCLVNMALAFVNIATWGTVSMENHEFHLQPVFRFASRQAPLWVGFAAGAIITTVSSMTAHGSSGPSNVIALALVAVVVVSFSFYGADDSATKHQLEALMTLDEVPEEDAEGTRSPEAPHGGDARPSFDARCAEVCERYGLSPREREVFALLARGRNAKIIQEELCVSASTAKTHIYRIYRKIGINSQQLLIDTVEGRSDPFGP